ncbi:TraX family protein [Pantoea sp. LMR881]|uniref:TraX family protein n=1 Tax=Pantoea sp. LMR881 TaxID=3014336 RepID=UPI003FA7EE41
MLADHVNTVLLHGSHSLLYAAGRMAFPLFTWSGPLIFRQRALCCSGRRCVYGWGFITQPVFCSISAAAAGSWLARIFCSCLLRARSFYPASPLWQ